MTTSKTTLSPEEIREGQERIKAKIYANAKELGLMNDDIWPMTDGVLNIEGYCKSEPRIMWILKQPYDDINNGTPCGGGWDVFGAFNNDDAHKNRTWVPITYSLYGIRNKLQFDNMPDIREDKSMIDLLKDIAYINIDKMPGRTNTSYNESAKAYKHWRGIIDEQIRLYDPQVICFANTFWLFKEDWKITDGAECETVSLTKGKSMLVYHKDGRLCLDTYHPAQHMLTRGVYVDAIINIVNKYFQER